VDEEGDRGDMQIQRSAPDGHPRDGPVTAANAKIGNREEVGAIMIDERKDHIRNGRLLGEGSSDLSHAQMFLCFSPLCTFEPSLPNWRKDVEIKQSPLTDGRAHVAGIARSAVKKRLPHLDPHLLKPFMGTYPESQRNGLLYF
jgi:hypothetical protein